jgi:hypothetical protein
MDALKIKIEIGDRKFEAEGPVDVVQAHVNAFMKLTVGGSAETLAAEAAAAERKARTVPLDKLLYVGGQTVYLRVKPRHAQHAVLLLMFGYRQLRNNHLLAGIDMIQGLRSAGYKQRRVDHILNSLARQKFVATEGKYRGRRYKLTDNGVERGDQIARELSAHLQPPPAAEQPATQNK